MEALAELPSSKATKAALISSIRDRSIDSTPDAAATASSNPLLNADDETKRHFLTLHALFPHELLPALDVLDRNLVTRLTPPVPAGQETARDFRETATAMRESDRHPDALTTTSAFAKNASIVPSRTFYVHSAQQRNTNKPGGSKYKAAHEMNRHYEVRLDAWTCSCPAFSFSAFPAHADSTPNGDPPARNGPAAQLSKVRQSAFGGLTATEHAPVCKHLLACLLVSDVGAFAHFVTEREASLEEHVAWAAGWGD